jgi:hypothetical protein
MKEKTTIEVQAVHDCIAKVTKAREAHALVVGKKDTSVKELNKLMENRAAVYERLRAREREIAVSGGKLPDEPFPEDTQLTRLDRHIRIGQDRVRDWERKVAESQSGIDALIAEMEESWVALGAATGDQLLKEFRQAALMMRDAQTAYVALTSYFLRSWEASAWKGFDGKLTLVDPMSQELILNPLHARLAEKWPPAAQMLRKDVDGLRAEADAVKSVN